MAVSILSYECSDRVVMFDGIYAKEPEHERCPRGHTMPGVLGGWVCSCPCHRGRVSTHPQTP